MQRRPSTQDLTWLLDLSQNQQLDLNPPYQRRSVWTRKDKQFFLDTIFRNFPSPAIFLHKTIDGTGKATYHVVDGKQRTQTILDFVADKIRLANDYGDVRLDAKRWSDLVGEPALKQQFWNYQFTVEMIDSVEGTIINEVFDRLNRNSRKLTRQELRHAKFDGWLINIVEAESVRVEWHQLGVVTPTRSKRMVECQFLSELLLVVLDREIRGFDQNALDDVYARYEEPLDAVTEFDAEAVMRDFGAFKSYLLEMNAKGAVVATHANGFGHFYTLWALVALSDPLPPAATLAERYLGFMQRVEELAKVEDLEAFLRDVDSGEYAAPLVYLTNSRGASTDLGPRAQRLAALQEVLLAK